MRTGRRELIRDLNRTLVLNLVRERRAISRADIARITGLSPSTVTSITGALLEDALLVEQDPGKRRRGGAVGSVGRPATLLRVDPAARHVIGIKLAPDTLTATVTDLDAEPLAMVTLPHATHADRDQVIDLFRTAVGNVLTEAGIRDEEPLGVGIGVPGGVHPLTGEVSRSPLPEWVDSDLATDLEEGLGVPVLVDNDVNTLTVAEHLYGSGAGLDHLLVVSVGRGIGMGAVLDGVLVRGSRGALGEIGHVQVRHDGRRCWCGRTGCLETVAAEPAVVRDVLAIVGRLVQPDGIAALAEGDGRVAALLAAAGREVGAVMATAAAMLDPQRIIVSGEGVRLGHHYLDGLAHELEARLMPEPVPDLVIEPWGDEAWARGAASLILGELFHPAHLRGERRTSGASNAPSSNHPPAVARGGRGGRRP